MYAALTSHPLYPRRRGKARGWTGLGERASWRAATSLGNRRLGGSLPLPHSSARGKRKTHDCGWSPPPLIGREPFTEGLGLTRALPAAWAAAALGECDG